MKFELRLFDALRQDPWFSQLPTPLQEQLLAIGVLQQLPAGQTVFHRGQEHAGIYCLLAGTVVVQNELKPGRESFLLNFSPPAWMGETGLFDGGSYTHSVVTESSCQLLFLARGLVRSILDTQPHYWLPMSLLLTSKLRLAYFAFDELVKLPPDVRLARRLLMKAAGLGNRSVYNPIIDVQQEQLAQSMGMARTSINPILSKWRKAGVIDLAYGRITIKDLEAFKAIAGYADWSAGYKESLALPLKDQPR